MRSVEVQTARAEWQIVRGWLHSVLRIMKFHSFSLSLFLVTAVAGHCADAGALISRPTTPAKHRITVDSLPPPDLNHRANRRPKEVPPPAEATLNVPEGFSVNVFAENVEKARWLALTPTGDVLVTQTRGNDIVLLRDADKDGRAEVRKKFAGEQNGLNQPFGIAFADGAVFIANTDSVMRFDYKSGQEALSGAGKKIHDLPGGGYNQHWTRNVVLTPDKNKLLVTVGSKSNVDVEPLPRASIIEMNLDGSASRTFASGLRNPIGLAHHPRTKELYVSVNERDRIGDDLVPDYVTRVQDGGFYGWPYAYLSPKNLDPRRMREGRSENPDLAAKTITPDVLIESHSAALGLTFYTGTAFPERYRTGAYVALRGSWNRNKGTGYKIIYVPFTADGRPEGGYEDFVTGFLIDPDGPTTWGRPVGIMEMPDGALLFTDDANGRVYRVTYTAKSNLALRERP
jgi:glucose/arabinose dehydrogenase